MNDTETHQSCAINNSHIQTIFVKYSTDNEELSNDTQNIKCEDLSLSTVLADARFTLLFTKKLSSFWLFCIFGF